MPTLCVILKSEVELALGANAEFQLNAVKITTTKVA
jgi:hypothetical protein